MRINFKLRKGEKVNSILIDLTYGRSIRVRCSTSLIIKKGSEKYWNSNKCRIKLPNDIHNADYINKKLRNYEIEIEVAIQDLEKNNRLNQTNCYDAIKRILNIDTIVINESEISNLNNVVIYFDWYMDFYLKKISPHSKKPLTAGTIKTYKNCKGYFEKYIKSRNIKTFYFEYFNKEFYYDFIEYGHENGYTRNYIGSMIQKLKTIISSAYDNGNHKNSDFTKPYTFPTLYDEVLQISITKLKEWNYLNPEQIKSGTITWSSNGEKTASISITVNTYSKQPYIELDYKYNDEPRKYKVRLVSIPFNLGIGKIWYFLCPQTYKRCRKLYSISGYFLHREAFNGCI